MGGQPKILLVEDNKRLCTIYAQFLHDAGYPVAVAADGEAALETARSYGPAIIFLDIMLPKKDGLAVLHILRHEPSYNCTKAKIVFLTNLGDTNKFAPQIQADIDGYALKSEITLESLLDIIHSFGGITAPQTLPPANSIIG